MRERRPPPNASEEVGHPGQAAGDEAVHLGHRVCFPLEQAEPHGVLRAQRARVPRRERADAAPNRAAPSGRDPRRPASTSTTKRSTPVTGSVTSSSTRPAARAGQPRAVIAASTLTMRCIQQRKPCISRLRCGSGSSQSSGDTSTSAECTNTTSLLCNSWPPRKPSRPRSASRCGGDELLHPEANPAPRLTLGLVAHVTGERVALVPAVLEAGVWPSPGSHSTERNQSGRSSGPSHCDEVCAPQASTAARSGLVRTRPGAGEAQSAPRSGRSAGRLRADLPAPAAIEADRRRMQRRDRGAALAGEAYAVTHQRTGHAAAAPCRMHRDGGDPLRRHGLPAEELTARAGACSRRRSRRPYGPAAAARAGAAAVSQRMLAAAFAGERLGVHLRKASQLRRHPSRRGSRSVARSRFHERPSVLAAPRRHRSFGRGVESGYP